jgi:hypothetical protein
MGWVQVVSWRSQALKSAQETVMVSSAVTPDPEPVMRGPGSRAAVAAVTGFALGVLFVGRAAIICLAVSTSRRV